MEILLIRSLVEKYTLSELQEAEFAIIQEEPVKIRVEGRDQAERLSNVIAACWILEEMKSRNIEFPEALQLYNKKVRDQVKAAY
jgi:hypothetical protein